jgi:hypothetical protein
MIRLPRPTPGLLVATLVVAGCGAGGAPPKAPFEAVWLGRESAAPTTAELARLEEAGVRELFVEAAELVWESGAPRLRERWAAAIPRQRAATLVITGRWHRPGESAKTTARAWRDALATFETAAPARGLLPDGVHFDVDPGAGARELTAVLQRLRRELGGRWRISATLPRLGLAERDIVELARVADFVVPFLYGQPPEESEVGERWDLAKMRAAVARMEQLERPYAIGAWTLGWARLRGRGGETLAEDRGLSLAAALRVAGLGPRPGAVFEGVDRQVVELRARKPADVGPWRLAAGETVRFVRVSTADLERFREAARAAGSERRLGSVFRRLPAAGERLALSAASIASALRPGTAEPDLEIRLVKLESSRRGARFRVLLVNRNDEETELGGSDASYVELRVPPGAVRAVDPGDFAGWELLYEGRERRSVRALTQADTLRLYAPYIGGRERIVSGPVEAGGAEVLEKILAGGVFPLSRGRILRLPVVAPAIEESSREETR